jgi:hypothetical protein
MHCLTARKSIPLLIFYVSFPSLSQCTGIDPLHCHSPWNQSSFSYSISFPHHCNSAWESIPCIVTLPESQSPFLFSMRSTPHCHSARESVPCTGTLHGISLLMFCEIFPSLCYNAIEPIPCIGTLHGSQSPFSFSVGTSPSLSQCTGINPPSYFLLDLPFTVTVHGNQSPALAHCTGVNPPSYFI